MQKVWFSLGTIFWNLKWVPLFLFCDNMGHQILCHESRNLRLKKDTNW
jgi:hypothetical protein